MVKKREKQGADFFSPSLGLSIPQFLIATWVRTSDLPVA